MLGYDLVELVVGMSCISGVRGPALVCTSCIAEGAFGALQVCA